jgi:hypothetical protein
MSDESYRKWEPVPDFPRRIEIDSVYHDPDGFCIVLKEPGERSGGFRLSFDKLLGFRSTSERYRMKLLQALTPHFPWPAFTVADSSWTAWFHEETLGIHRDWQVLHFVFLGNDIIEVLSASEPSIEKT